MPSLDLGRMIQRLDGELVVALEAAVAIAVRYGHASAEPEHWVLGLDETSDSYARVIEAAGGDRAAIADSATRALERRPRGHESAPAIGTGIIDLAREGWLYASLNHGRSQIDVLDLLYVALSDSSLRALTVGAMTPLRDVRLGALEQMIEDRPAMLGTPGGEAAASAAGTVGGDVGGASGGGSSSFLASYTVDMTEQARSGAIDPIVGRDAEMRQIVDILLRRRQNNPILVGEAGVGKTAAVEAFALQIAGGDVPDSLKDIRLLSLDLTLLQAGAGVKGEFERRLKGVIDEVKASADPIVLFIDEAHTMIGAGGQAGQGDAANILKPALARGELRTIAATTWAEYKKFFEKDAALTRRFQTVTIDEPDEETAVRMLRAITPTLEKHHGVPIREGAVRAAVALSKRYIQARQLPDKAVSVLDTACASVAISRAALPGELADAMREREQLHLERERLEGEPDYSPASERSLEIELRLADLDEAIPAMEARLERERELVARADAAETGEQVDRDALAAIEGELREVQGDEPLVHRVVTPEGVAGVIARWTGVPLGRLMTDLVQTVQTLEDSLRERVIGQDHALRAIADAMVTARAGLGDPRRPPGVFLMVGTSGVGKTETALALADLLYGGEDKLTVINMSEFKEEHKVSLLLGSPPGYVGFGEGGVLTEAVRRRPYGALLLDEIDKAHPGVQDIFYQVFDKGMLKDGEGRDVDFKNTTIMMTANTGTRTLTALAADPDTMPEGDGAGEALAQLLQPELTEEFKPAFLGRVAVVPFLPLADDVLRGIVGLQLGKVRRRLHEQYGATLEVEDAVTEHLVAKSRTVDSGARAVEATISRDILPQMSRKILPLTLQKRMPGSVVLRDSQDGHILVEVVEQDAAAAVGAV